MNMKIIGILKVLFQRHVIRLVGPCEPDTAGGTVAFEINCLLRSS